MSVELRMLLLSAALLLILPFIYGYGAGQQLGAATLLGNRENLPEIKGWAGRGQRAHRNLLENLLPFAIVVFAADALQISTPLTVAGAELFFAARIVHAGSYIAGIKITRSLAHFATVTGIILIGSQLF